ncbi:MAG: hemolysin III family protein [Gammaproteobacteria bacterium]|nr:hemolysin III family protein [Gammaproteobacteria bacterium]
MSGEYTIAEEIAHSITHGLGILFAIAALTMMVAYSSVNGSVWQVVSSSIYGTTLILMYSASTLYHGVFHTKTKALLKKLDHAAIYLLIAGTYTPYFLVSLRESINLYYFIGLWTFAILGVVFEFIHIKALKKLSITLFLGMGWFIVFLMEPLSQQLEKGGLILLTAGGIAYSFGVIFYVWDKLHFNHAIWHVFVLAGSVLHFCSIFLYVIIP